MYSYDKNWTDLDCEIEESYSSTLQAGWTKNILH